MMASKQPSKAYNQESLEYNTLKLEMSDRLIKLLSEYTAKLEILIAETESSRRSFIAIATIFIITNIIITMVVIYQFNIDFPVILVITSTIFLTTLQFYSSAQSKKNSSQINLATSTRHLEKLIQQISQFYEHNELDLGRRIEIDIRLSEAEDILQYIRNRK